MKDVFLPRDVPVDASVGKIDEVDRELEEFKRFCVMAKPLESQPKVAVKVDLKDLTLKKPTRTPRCRIRNSAFQIVIVMFVITSVCQLLYKYHYFIN